MRTDFHSYLRVVPHMALGLFICVSACEASAQAAKAAPDPAPIAKAAPAPAAIAKKPGHTGKKALGQARRAPVDVPSMLSKPQRPVKPLRQR
jgi:hypothetical protein